jgi:hypothetical protein
MTDATNDSTWLPWRKHWVGDHAMTTRGWPIAARIALIELLDRQWMQGSLANDPEMLRAVVVCTPREWSVAWRFVEPEFPICEDGLRRNRRVSIERDQKNTQRQKSSDGGKNSAAKRARLRSINGGLDEKETT